MVVGWTPHGPRSPAETLEVKAAWYRSLDESRGLVKTSFPAQALGQESISSEAPVAPRLTGRYTSSVAGGQPVEAFIPAPLPPRDPALALAGKLTKRLHEAEQALARLELAGEMVPSIDWLLYAFVRKEAVLSSQIEGTQASLIDLFNYEAADGVAPSADVEEGDDLVVGESPTPFPGVRLANARLLRLALHWERAP